jgi:hypothetical protein
MQNTFRSTDFSENKQSRISPLGEVGLYLTNTNQTNVSVNPSTKFHVIYSVISEMNHAKQQA